MNFSLFSSHLFFIHLFYVCVFFASVIGTMLYQIHIFQTTIQSNWSNNFTHDTRIIIYMKKFKRPHNIIKYIHTWSIDHYTQKFLNDTIKVNIYEKKETKFSFSAYYFMLFRNLKLLFFYFSNFVCACVCVCCSFFMAYFNTIVIN